MSNAASKNIWRYFLLALLIVVAVAERIYGIDRQSLWTDELFAVMASYKPFSGAWAMMLADSHPPGYLTFMYYLLPVTGYSDFGVRFHALFFGVLWLPLVFILCRRWFSTNAALIATAVVASAYNAVYYSQEARVYTMLLACTLWNVICFFEILFANKYTKWHQAGFLLSATIMLYLHYAGFVFLCAEILLSGTLWVVYKRHSFKEFLILFGVPMLLYSPWFVVMYNNLVYAPDSWAISDPVSFHVIHKMLAQLLGPDVLHFRLYICVIPLAIFFAIKQQKSQGLTAQLRVVYSTIFLIIVPVVAFIVESWLGTPILEIRYVMVALLLVAILAGWLCNYLIECWLSGWIRSFFVTTLVIFLTVWAVRANIQFGLYSVINKHPIREAVAFVRNDVKKNAIGSNYTVVISHSYFEHYLRRNNIDVDVNWPGHLYNVPQKIGLVKNYLDSHSNVNYLYYLMLEPNDGAALSELKYRYKLVSEDVASCVGCAAHVFKFNVKEKPDATQLESVGTNPVNELARAVAADVEGKDASTYRVLFTHRWLLPYLERNGVLVQCEGWPSEYLANGQADGVFQYVKQHPEVDTLYYLALQEPNAEGAELMLQLRYHLLGETTVDTKIGKLSLLTYKVKEEPVVNSKILQRLRAGESNKVAEWLLDDIDGAPAESFAVSVANDWLVPYVKFNGIPFDESWLGSRYRFGVDDQEVERYIMQRPAIGTLYYVALRESVTELALAKLQKQYTQLQQESIPVAMGIVDIYKFDTKKKPPNGK